MWYELKVRKHLQLDVFSDKWFCLSVIVYVTGRAGWAEWWTFFVVISFSGRTTTFCLQDVSWGGERELVFVCWCWGDAEWGYHCGFFMLCFHDWLSNCLRCCVAFNWDVSLMMCWWGCAQNHFFLLRLRSSCFMVCWCSCVVCGENCFVLQLCFRLGIVEVACISGSMCMQVTCIKLIHVCSLSMSLFFVFEKSSYWFRANNLWQDIYLFQSTSAVRDAFLLLYRRVWNYSKEDLVDL